MIRITTVFIFLCVITTSFAQTEKGRFLVGGNVDISSSRQGSTGGFNMALSPAFSVFVVKNFAIGGRYTFGVTSSRVLNSAKTEYNTTTTFTSGVGPLLRYYVGKKPLKGIFSANVNYLTSTTLKNDNITGTEGFSFTGFAGMAYFFNTHVSIESGMYFSSTGYVKQLPTTRIGFSVGVFVFLDKKNKAKE